MQKTAGSKKFSFYLISHIDGVKTCKNSFFGQFLEFEASVWLDISYFENTEECWWAEECVTRQQILLLPYSTNRVKTCKNGFLANLGLKGFWSDNAYYESIELSLEAEDCVSHMFACSSLYSFLDPPSQPAGPIKPAPSLPLSVRNKSSHTSSHRFS